MAFFQLFPYGENAFDEPRLVPISHLQYIQVRLLGSTLRFQQNEYIFYWLSRVMHDMLKRSIAMSAKLTSMRD